jgi:hypothetical protein
LTLWVFFFFYVFSFGELGPFVLGEGPGFVLVLWGGGGGIVYSYGGTSILFLFFFSTADFFFLFQILGGPWPQPVPP